MKIATWNLWWRYDDWKARRSAILTTLRKVDADVIALQEVWHSPDENLAESLADDLGYDRVFAPSPAPEKWQRRIGDNTVGIGNAIISRWPISATQTKRLPAGNALDEGRIALHASIDTPNGSLPIVCTHLNSGWGQSTIRTEQLRAAGELIVSQPSGEYPPMLCGDFNATQDYDEVRALAGKRDLLVPGLVMLDAWTFARTLDPGHTWDRRNPHVAATHEPSARIDYIFVGLATGTGTGTPLSCGLFGNEPVDGTWPSDHCGVWAELQQ